MPWSRVSSRMSSPSRMTWLRVGLQHRARQPYARTRQHRHHHALHRTRAGRDAQRRGIHHTHRHEIDHAHEPNRRHKRRRHVLTQHRKNRIDKKGMRRHAQRSMSAHTGTDIRGVCPRRRKASGRTTCPSDHQSWIRNHRSDRFSCSHYPPA